MSEYTQTRIGQPDEPMTWDGEPPYCVETVAEGLFDATAFETIPGQLALENDAPEVDAAADGRPTYRERRLRRADRLRQWSASNTTKTGAARAASDSVADGIPMGQPILVGHHSERRHRRDVARIEQGMRRSIELNGKAAAQAAAADEIERQAADAIYSDDPDAIERLTIKLRTLEAQRAEAKVYNAACRKAAKRGEAFPPELEAAPAWIRREVASMSRIGYLEQGGALPAHVASNLTGNITRTRKRLEALQREARG